MCIGRETAQTSSFHHPDSQLEQYYYVRKIHFFLSNEGKVPVTKKFTASARLTMACTEEQNFTFYPIAYSQKTEEL